MKNNMLYVEVGTGVTGNSSVMYIGPFESEREREAFMTTSQMRFESRPGELGCVCLKKCTFVPKGYGAVPPALLNGHIEFKFHKV